MWIKFVENRRSTQTILDVARSVAEQNTELLDKEINLKAVNDEVVTKDNKVRLNIYYDEVSQAADIVKEIDELINSSTCPIDKETKDKDRAMRKLLARARCDYNIKITNDGKGGGYYLPTAKESIQLAKNNKREDKKAVSIFRNHKGNKALEEDYRTERIKE